MKIAVAALLLFCSAPIFGQSAASSDFGEVSFANSGSPAAQADFIRGLAQLHNFEYEDAAVHFRAAEKIDPDFAMAYWGEALTFNHGIWHQQDLPAAKEALSRLGATPEARQAKAPTQREKDYLRTIEVLYGEGSKEDRDQLFEAAMAQLHRKYPDDIDATAFYALAILSSAEHGRDFATYMRAAAVLEEVFPRHSRHPGVVHYLIHSYDDPIHAPLGLRPARIYALIAPEAAHAQHMTSHIFLALGMWDEVVKANEVAMAVVNRRRVAEGKPANFCGHYSYWLEYGYLQQGRVADARRLLEGCYKSAEAQAAELSDKAKTTVDPNNDLIGSYAAMRASFLVDSALWQDEVAGWQIPVGNYPSAQLTLDYADALVAYHNSQFKIARESLLHMEADLKLEIARLDKQKLDDPTERTRTSLLVDQVRALLASTGPTSPAAITGLQVVAAKERAMPLEFGPPSTYKPTDEILGELFLQMDKPLEAQQSFKAALALAPGRTRSVQGMAKAEQQLALVKPPATDGQKSQPANSHLH